jgi:hypothetical protein
MFCHAHNLNQSVFKYKRLIEKVEIPMRSDLAAILFHVSEDFLPSATEPGTAPI